MTDPPQALVQWLGEQLGGAVALTPAAGSTGAVQTWRVVAAGQLYYCRDGLSLRKFDQELRVAEAVWPLLGGCPERLGADRAGGRLLMSACAGSPAPQDPAAWRAAGERVARLHALPLVDADPVSPVQALVARIAAASRSLQTVEPARVAGAARLLGAGEALASQRRCWCHRDLRPENWLWDGDILSLVDWEHARPDLPALDLVLPATADEGRSSAFFEGYGPVDAHALRAARALYGLGTLAWGHRHGQAAFVQEGRRILDAALAECGVG